MKPFALVVLAVTLATSVPAAQDLERLFKAAVNTEMVDRNCKAAIDQYKKVAAGSNRPLAAQALLRMADCYQKLGDAEAQRVYQRLVDDFADQKETARLAHERLNRPTQQQTAGTVGRTDEVVWSGPEVTMDVWPLPDGRSVVHWDLATGNLAFRDLRSGETRLLTNDAAGEAIYLNPVVSPSGTRIAVRYDSSIRLVSVDGRRNDVLLRDAFEHSVVGWSPDERYLAAERWPGDGTVTFDLISTVDGSIRQLLTPAGGGSLGGFSRDGRLLVFTRNGGGTAPGGVYLMTLTGSAILPLFESPHQFTNPVWSPDGRYVFFNSNRSGTPSLWSVEVTDGKPVGEPVLREAGFNQRRFLVFTRDGTLFYGHSELQLDIYMAAFDPAALRVTNPTRLTEFFVGRNSYPVISPDGRHVAFVRRSDAGPTVVLLTLESKDERTLATFQRPYGANTLHWFPDGNALLLTDMVERRKRFRRIDIRTGESTTLFEAPWALWTGALSSDGKTLFYSVKDDEGVGNRLVKRNLASGGEQEIYRTPPLVAEGTGLFGLSVSPSGDRVAFTRNVDEGCVDVNPPALCRLLMIVSSDGSERREMLRSSRLFFQGPIGWTSDGRHLIVTLSGVGDRSQHLYAMAVDSGELKPLGLEMPQISSRVVSADGRRIAVTKEAGKNELRALRNILPAPEK